MCPTYSSNKVCVSLKYCCVYILIHFLLHTGGPGQLPPMFSVAHYHNPPTTTFTLRNELRTLVFEGGDPLPTPPPSKMSRVCSFSTVETFGQHHYHHHLQKQAVYACFQWWRPLANTTTTESTLENEPHMLVFDGEDSLPSPPPLPPTKTSVCTRFERKRLGLL